MSGEIVGSQGRWRHTADRAFLMEPPRDMKNWTGGGGDHSNTEPELPVVNGEVHGCVEKPAEIGECRAHSRQRDVSDGLVKSKC